LQFDASFSFIFSPRPGTPAAALPDDTTHAVKLARLQRLQAALGESTAAIGQSRVGTVQQVLVEGPSKRNATELMGRTECNRIVNFAAGAAGQRLVGQMVDLRIVRAYPHSLRGELMLHEPATI
jgi:tRNA-2-methylthio-N6-dimethylallyladenosine synthase